MSGLGGYFEGREHVLPVRVYYEDTDLTGVVYHAGHVRFFERGRSDFLRLAGIDHASLLARADPAAFAVTKLTVEYKAAARIDEALEVRTLFERPHGIRMIISQRILRGQALIATAAVEVVCIDAEGRVRRPPSELVETLRPLVGSVTP